MNAAVISTLIFVAILCSRCVARGNIVVKRSAMRRALKSNTNDASVLYSSTTGVPIDWSHNKTLAALGGSGEDIPSAPGCPTSIRGFPWVYYGNPPRCFLVGTTGPCFPGHILFGKGLFYGQCDCLCSPEMKSGSWNRAYDVHLSDHFRFLFCSIKDIPEMNDAVYDKQSATCYYLDTQGPCRQGEWLVRDNNRPGEVKCVPQCTQLTSSLHSSVFYNWQSGICEQKPRTTNILPVALTGAISPGACDDGLVFSKTLQKCITKSKAFLLFM